ncbi:NAD(P)-dependent dehydrogenase (short-subunit alcohol dehydrogenase family) [Rhodococcus sp. PvR044]|uniref:SDR family NAD(P)-dependent oxidoreductase n=1 Tax=unclassified Rhodococcus (in: high G+C Gram-positive bacteria) TaxID=192944 RepID=UPI001AE9F125|nr:SDR family NAD(P)-dependent oxidoreductase [Rhodococcus sp. PvR099]MBP1159708.1 NAD(P)-dependent dehydrogenase (short-subunit alcohol dehydrogenase family) [Rhodococcus sp. PvR099]
MTAFDLRDLAGTTAVVTGAASGIGAAIARRAAGLGMRVALADFDGARLDEVAREIAAAGGEALAVRCDVTAPDDLERLAATTVDRFGSVRLLVNNAGIDSTGRLWELDPERFDRVLGVNVTGVFHGIRAFVPRMLAAGGPAHIVNTASIGAVTTVPTQAAYCASKHATLAMTECLAIELAAERAPITVAALLPGPVHTAIYESAGSDGSAGAATRDRMESFLRENGVTPEQAADTMFEGLAAGRFWIYTHPERADDLLRLRADRLTGHLAPTAP